MRARWGELDAFTEFVLSSIGHCATWAQSKAGDLEPGMDSAGNRRAVFEQASTLLATAQRMIAIAMGAGADQAPGEAPEARDSATRRAAAPERGHGAPPLPNQPLRASPARREADGSWRCVWAGPNANGVPCNGLLERTRWGTWACRECFTLYELEDEDTMVIHPESRDP